MNSHPNIDFQLNLELDKWTCKSSMFYNSVIKDHPGLVEGKNLEPEAKKAFNDKYVDDYYKTHRKELEDAKEKMGSDWLKINKRFFEVTNKMFDVPWPEGKYICYLSIFNCNPRFIETKEFQTFYKHPATTNYVCAHEMLHFIFYAYVGKNFDQEYKGLGEKVIWKLSEIFNDVVLRLPKFVAITGQKDPAFYAETKQELDDAIKLWEETKTVKAFIAKYFMS
ncbi:MAG: hypothetical protein WC988_01550 [Patescibacteria group bacterium]